ncbi:MAG: carbon-nitrogen hydrolase family protein [Bacteroidetes bacterium]|nr:carbon-nitrogen hydrolase family protein [Bacteroidota bacterium]
MKTANIENKSKFYILSLFVLLFLVQHSFAANKVRIATIGAVSPSVNKAQAPAAFVDQMISFWNGQLSQVLKSKLDLIVLPEACDVPSGLSYPEQKIYIKERKNRLLEFFASKARENNTYIAFGSIHETEQGLRNSVIMLDRNGQVAGTYHKNFPTINEMEAGIIPSEEVPIVQCDFGKVAMSICFDLNYDELRSKYIEQQPDIILFSSVYHGGLMQGIWAYSCRAFLVSAIGVAQLPSEIVNPLGEVISSSTNYFNYTVSTINLDYKLAHLDYNWDRLKKLKTKYGDDVNIHDPGKVGSVMISSEDKSISAAQMAREFDIELLDAYFDRSRTFRKKELQKVGM